VILSLKKKIETILNFEFDYLLMNYYRNGKDYIGYHADREARPEGKNVIASLSFGVTRRFLFRHRKKIELGVIEYALTHGAW